jgi:hypothetical protein
MRTGGLSIIEDPSVTGSSMLDKRTCSVEDSSNRRLYAFDHFVLVLQNWSDVLNVEMLVCQQDVHIDFELNAKALRGDGIEAHGHRH